MLRLCLFLVDISMSIGVIMKKMMLSTLLILTASCSSDQVDDNKKSNSASTEKSISTTITQLPESNSKNIELDTDKNRLTYAKTYSYRLNERKFTSSTDILMKGSPVSSPTMSEDGVLKGGFVVITTKTTEQLFPGYQVKKIAKDTYQLTPLKAQANLYVLYLDLLDNGDFSRVEIEIDFSQPFDAQSY